MLECVVNCYNDSVHSITKYTPLKLLSINDAKTIKQLHNKLLQKGYKRIENFNTDKKLRVGSKVRKSL